MSSTLRAGLRRNELVEVVRAATCGDQVAITELVNHCLPQVASYVAQRGSTHPEALANLVMAEFVRGLDRLKFDDPGQIWSYIYRMSRSRLLDERRKVQLEQSCEMVDIIDEQNTRFDEGVANQLLVRDLLSGLTDDQRRVVELRFKDDLTLEETARRVGKTLTAVKGLQRRALATLAAAAAIIVLLLAGNQATDRIRTSDPAVVTGDGSGSTLNFEQQVVVERLAATTRSHIDAEQSPDSTQRLRPIPPTDATDALTQPTDADDAVAPPLPSEPDGMTDPDSVEMALDVPNPVTDELAVEVPPTTTPAETVQNVLPGQDGTDGTNGADGTDGDAAQPNTAPDVSPAASPSAVDDNAVFFHQTDYRPWLTLDVTENDDPSLDTATLRVVDQPDSGFVDRVLVNDHPVLRFYPDGPGTQLFQYELCGPDSCSTANVSVIVHWYTEDACANLTPTIEGTPGDDILQGTEGPDIIFGYGGDDRIFGNGGDDIICGGSGVDIIDGHGGNDILYGGRGGDDIVGDDGDDVIYGGAGIDYLDGDAGVDAIYGGDGGDHLTGGGGKDFLFGEDGNDSLTGNGNADYLSGGIGDDALHGSSGTDLLYGGVGDDQMEAGGGTDRLFGGFGNDSLTAVDASDALHGDDGVDLCLNRTITTSCEAMN